MQRIFQLLAPVVLLLFALPASAQRYLQLDGSGTTVARVIAPGLPDGGIRLLSLDATGDNATNHVVFRMATRQLTLVSNVLSTATNIFVAQTNVNIGDLLVLQSGESAVFAAVNSTNGTQLGFAAETGLAMTAGDPVWVMGDSARTVIGSTTVRWFGQALAVARRMPPLVIEVTGTSASAVNNAVVIYD